MATFKKITSSSILLALYLAEIAYADNEKIADTVDEIIVTGVAGPSTMLAASISVSTLATDDIEKLSPRSFAEVFRSLPGIRAESSGGGGNANMTIRGIPLATGGSKYMQIQEDGLPVLEYGDINFGNADNFIRFDNNVARIESVRGGSASTLASNSPGGIINILNKTGEVEGGGFTTTNGLDYDEFRTDIDYGGRISDSVYFHLGGFFHSGEGTRETGTNGQRGGQLKFTISKEFDKGFIRFNLKNLSDKVATYLPSPVQYAGAGKFNPLPNYDASTQTLQSADTDVISTYNVYGSPQTRHVADGIESNVMAIGFEFENELADGLAFNNKFKTSRIKGGFIAPFTDGWAGGTSTIAAKGQALCDSASVGGVALNCTGGINAIVDGKMANPNQLAFTNLLFDAKYNQLGLDVNDLKLSKHFEYIDITVGYYFSQQAIDVSWNSWGAFLQTVDGGKSKNIQYEAVNAGIDSNGRKTNVLLSSNGALSESFLGYEWALQYTTNAPYVNTHFNLTDAFSVDLSARYDQVQARGLQLNLCCGGNTSIDLNGNGQVGSFAITNGIITRLDSDALLENNQAINAGFVKGGIVVLNQQSAVKVPVNYDATHTAYSLGGAYLLTQDSSLFARYSQGGRAIADRLTQIAGALKPDGSLTATTDGFDTVKQLESGYKYITPNLSALVTVFSTLVDESNADITTGETFLRQYKTTGVELEGQHTITNHFSIHGNATWTHANIHRDALNPAVIGNTPRRQASVIWTISPEYSFSTMTVGAALQGTTGFNLGDNEHNPDHLYQKGYNIIHIFGTWHISDALYASININNITNLFALTEAEESIATAGSYVRGRPLNGRTASLSLRYDFL